MTERAPLPRPAGEGTDDAAAAPVRPRRPMHRPRRRSRHRPRRSRRRRARRVAPGIVADAAAVAAAALS